MKKEPAQLSDAVKKFELAADILHRVGLHEAAERIEKYVEHLVTAQKPIITPAVTVWSRDDVTAEAKEILQTIARKCGLTAAQDGSRLIYRKSETTNKSKAPSYTSHEFSQALERLKGLD